MRENIIHKAIDKAVNWVFDAMVICVCVFRFCLYFAQYMEGL